MITVAVQPSRAAANATPWAWLPALAATTPRARGAWESLAIRWYAPRPLNEPVRCRFSHFRYTGPATVSESTQECSTGVSEITSRSSLRAAVTSSELTAGVIATGSKCATPGADAKKHDHDILSNSATTRAASSRKRLPQPAATLRHRGRAARERSRIPRRQGRDQAEPARHAASRTGPLPRHRRVRRDRPAALGTRPDRRARHHPAGRARPGKDPANPHPGRPARRVDSGRRRLRDQRPSLPPGLRSVPAPRR